jgi:hypothetical protein
MKMRTWLLIPIFFLASCTSFNRLDGHQEVALSTLLSEGDKARVVMTNGDAYYLEIVRVTEDELVGTQLSPPDRPGPSYGTGATLKISDIETIEIETIDGAKTTLAIAGGIVLLPFAILGVFFGAAAGDL